MMEPILIEPTSIRVGADPEMFIFDRETKSFKSVIGMIGGSKDSPRKLDKGISVQEDNVLAEFNIPPAATKEEFIFSIESAKFQISKLLPVETFELKICSSAFMPAEELQHPKADEFGCTPDFNAWTNSKNRPPAVPTDGLRSAGGHIHIGFKPSDLLTTAGLSRKDMSVELVKLCDLYLGVPSLFMDRDMNRRKLYGKAGCFRHKSYGVEYRTLSSFWLKDVPHIDWAYSQTQRAIEQASKGNFIPEELGKRIEKTINDADLLEASKLKLEEDLAVID